MMLVAKYKSYALFILVAGLLSHAFSLIWLFTGYFAPSPDSLWVDHLYKLKESYAQSIRGPKMVVVAGSSGLYGISAAKLENHFSIPTVNMATHGDLRDYYLYRAKKILRSGDLVILAPEYTQYWYRFPMSSTKADYIINFDRSCFKDLPLSEKIEILKTYIHPWKLVKNSAQAYKLALPESKLYENNRNGDSINNIGRELAAASPVFIPDYFSPDRYVVRKIIDFIIWCRKHNIKVLVTWPGTLPFEDNGFVESLIRFYAKRNIEIIGRPDDFFVPEEFLFDTIYHLNRDGVDFRTSKLIKLLEGDPVFIKWWENMAARFVLTQPETADSAWRNVCFNGGAEMVSGQTVRGWAAVTGNEYAIWGKAGVDGVIVRNGACSFRLQNTSAKQIKWRGRRVELPPHVHSMQVDAWSRSEDMDPSAAYGVIIRVSFKDGSFSWEEKNLHFQKNSTEWVNVSSVFEFDKEVAAIQPFLILYAGRGTAWFDDIRILVPSGADQKLQSVAHSEAAVSDAGLMD